MPEEETGPLFPFASQMSNSPAAVAMLGPTAAHVLLISLRKQALPTLEQATDSSGEALKKRVCQEIILQLSTGGGAKARQPGCYLEQGQ